MTIARQKQGVTISAVKYPPCECGEPYAKHVVKDCPGYRPAGLIRDLGTRAYTPSGSLSWIARILCRTAWAIERRLQGWRERAEQRVS